MCTRVRWKAMKIKSFMFAFMPCTKLLKSSNVPYVQRLYYGMGEKNNQKKLLHSTEIEEWRKMLLLCTK